MRFNVTLLTEIMKKSLCRDVMNTWNIEPVAADVDVVNSNAY